MIPLYFRLPKITVNHLFIHKLLYGLGFAPNADLAIYTLTCYTHPYTFIHVAHTHSYMNIYTMPAYTLLPGCLDKSQCVLLRNTALIATHIHIWKKPSTNKKQHTHTHDTNETRNATTTTTRSHFNHVIHIVRILMCEKVFIMCFLGFFFGLNGDLFEWVYGGPLCGG